MLTAESERSLRQAFARMGNDANVPKALASRLEGHAARAWGRRRLRTGALGATAAAVAAIVAFAALFAVSSRGASTRRAPAVLRLASYTFRLPAGYRARTSATSTTDRCAAPIFFRHPSGSLTPNATVVPATTLPYSSTIETAASGRGGCIVLALLPTYTPTATLPDSEAAVPPSAELIPGPTRLSIDGHVAYLLPWPTEPSLGTSVTEELFVELPLPNGRQRDLLASTTSLTPSELVAIVTQGLASP